ncbi:putative acyl- thioesterase II [Rosellinia necatrix]|uniref:Putative acyl-thioesterase II n=1 Tax=Rosellinia necatrix TaxID=77044 RepID=A0A1W2TV58_ROSNE|nr:putative acyl- thioesterase II [Rosellinia necatrix]
MSTGRPTLVRTPPVDESKAPIENALELTELSIIGPDLFTNTRELWHPPGARGLYGGSIIAQTLAAAQRTVPPDFTVHSYHCFFVLAGDSSVPILYHVERVREGRSFCTRTVQARQRGHAIFTVTCSFTRDGSGGPATVSHAAPMPEGVPTPPEGYEEPTLVGAERSPFEHFKCARDDAALPAERRKIWQWVRARGRISEDGGRDAHLSALAYMSDSYFIGTVSRIHRLWRFPFRPEEMEHLDPDVRAHLNKLNDIEGDGAGTLEDLKDRPRVGMMVSLDHSIYFHNPSKVRADEWMFTEMESPWAGDGRGVVMQKIFSRDGTLLATAIQEGVVRLKQDKKEPAPKL